MLQYVSGRPSFDPRTIFTKSTKRESPFPLSEKKYYFFFSARYALAAAIQALGLKPGNQLLMPSYNCGVEIDPLLHLNIKPIFYKIKKDLSPDLDDLQKKITSNVKGVLITHFLGFPQPVDQIKQACTESNIFLIEDCAHAFLSNHNGKPLGSYGDVGIFSLLKSLPVPNGGVLVINNRNINRNHYPEKPNFFATLFYATELLKDKTADHTDSIKERGLRILYDRLYFGMCHIRLVLVGFRKYVNPKGLYLVKPDSYLFMNDLCSWGISGLSKRILNYADLEEIKSIRRRNFEYLLSHFLRNERGILPFNKLPPGVCPLFFPIILESADRRETLYKILKVKGVITHPWWDRFHPQVPWDEFPDAVHLKAKLFGLPIHQDLTYRHLDRIIEEFEKAYQSR